jgi:hypothetical protein
MWTFGSLFILKSGSIIENYNCRASKVTQVVEHLPSPEFKPQYHQKKKKIIETAWKESKLLKKYFWLSIPQIPSILSNFPRERNLQPNTQAFSLNKLSNLCTTSLSGKKFICIIILNPPQNTKEESRKYVSAYLLLKSLSLWQCYIWEFNFQFFILL